MAERAKSLGCEILNSRKVEKIRASRNELVLETFSGSVRARDLVNCAGLFSDHLARQMEGGAESGAGKEDDIRIIPFRGEYYRLTVERSSLVQGLIYPLPDPLFPFLGVHLTRTIHEEVEAGPNAVVALAREGYRKTDISLTDLRQTLAFPGFWSLTRRYWKTGLSEIHRSLSKRAFAKALQRLVPEIAPEDLVPGGSGVRAQAVSAAGFLVDDFVIRQTAHAIHVLNAPSPAATASLAIADTIAGMADRAFSLKR
jgi:L-2-hydroxyglutarate oxidase